MQAAEESACDLLVDVNAPEFLAPKRMKAPYEIVGGVPARHIGWRYDAETIAAMERIGWWDWSHETLKERLKEFNDVEKFVQDYDTKS